MLLALLAYTRGAGVDTRWLVLDGVPEFFRLTKRIHNLLHGSEGDAGPLGDEERELYESVLADNLAQLRQAVSPGDIVLLHDPQTAGLVAGLRELGAIVVWRCHVGRDSTNECTDLAWGFLQPYVEQADASVFSRAAYVPAWLSMDDVRVIPPSLDPFSAKNAELAEHQVHAVLRRAELVDAPMDGGHITYPRRDGSIGEVQAHSGLIEGGQRVPRDARVVLQVSRWDRLKDMAGVLTGFADHLTRLPDDVHLMLVGPSAEGVSDDPEGAEVLEECLGIWRAQPADRRARLHLCNLPMSDIDENATLVNALQRYATVVVQKSLVEGFGLTVTEPMWKARAVVASRVGGIQDQIESGSSGLLLDDPADLDGFADHLGRLLEDESLAASLGAQARERVRDQYLGDRHLIQYVGLFAQLLDS
jgi:trehalose synthase